jgi:hypothetical protein
MIMDLRKRIYFAGVCQPKVSHTEFESHVQNSPPKEVKVYHDIARDMLANCIPTYNLIRMPRTPRDTKKGIHHYITKEIRIEDHSEHFTLHAYFISAAITRA